MKDVRSLSPVFPQPPLWAPGRPTSVRHIPNGPLTVSAPTAMMSAMTSAKVLMRSVENPAVSVDKPMPEHTSALLAAKEDTAADMGEALPQQARRAWHKQQYGACSVTGPEKGPDQETALFLERQHSPNSPLDAIDFLDSTLTPRPLSGVPPSKSTSGVPSSDKLRGVPTAAAGLAELPTPGSCAIFTSAAVLSAFTAAASCPSNFVETNDEEDAAHVEDGFRTTKSYERLVDELLDMSVSSLLTSSPRHLSSQLSSQHQQETFGGVAVQEKLIGGR
ncbi:g5218 [Coccomyxa elongata]